MASSKHKTPESVILLGKIPLINRLYEQLGLQFASVDDRKLYLDETYRWRREYVTSQGQPAKMLLDRRDPKVQRELKLMATKFLEDGDNAQRFWSSSRAWWKEGSVKFPDDREKIIELLTQLFWRQIQQRDRNDKIRDKTQPSPQQTKGSASMEADHVSSDDLDDPSWGDPCLPNQRSRDFVRRRKAGPKSVKTYSRKRKANNEISSARPTQRRRAGQHISGPISGGVIDLEMDELGTNCVSPDRLEHPAGSPGRSVTPLNAPVASMHQQSRSESQSARRLAAKSRTGGVKPLPKAPISQGPLQRGNPLEPLAFAAPPSRTSSSLTPCPNSSLWEVPIETEPSTPYSRDSQSLSPDSAQPGNEEEEVFEIDYNQALPTPSRRQDDAYTDENPGSLQTNNADRIIANNHQLPTIDLWILTHEPKPEKRLWPHGIFIDATLAEFKNAISQVTKRGRIADIELSLETPYLVQRVTITGESERIWDLRKESFLELLQDVIRRVRSGRTNGAVKLDMVIEPSFEQAAISNREGSSHGEGGVVSRKDVLELFP